MAPGKFHKSWGQLDEENGSRLSAEHCASFGVCLASEAIKESKLRDLKFCWRPRWLGTRPLRTDGGENMTAE